MNWAKEPKKGDKSQEKGFLCIRVDDFDLYKMKNEYTALQSNKSILAHRAFIRKYSKEKRAQNEVALIKNRIN